MIQSRNLAKSGIDRALADQMNLRSCYERLEFKANQAGAVNQQIRAESRILVDWFRDNRAIFTGKQSEPDR